MDAEEFLHRLMHPMVSWLLFILSNILAHTAVLRTGIAFAGLAQI
jgi:hypothetical protein